MLHLKINEGESYNQLCLERTGDNPDAGEMNSDSSLEGRPLISIIRVFKAVSLQPYIPFWKKKVFSLNSQGFWL